jgi:hypothetical protein
MDVLSNVLTSFPEDEYTCVLRSTGRSATKAFRGKSVLVISTGTGFLVLALSSR